jgi:hypothetical protein
VEVLYWIVSGLNEIGFAFTGGLTIGVLIVFMLHWVMGYIEFKLRENRGRKYTFSCTQKRKIAENFSATKKFFARNGICGVVLGNP